MAIEREYVEWYCRAIYNATDQHFESRGWNKVLPMVYPEYGRRYTRIVVDDTRSRFVHAFVDMTNGDVIKAAGWKAPQKGKYGLAVRFNLIDDESRERGFRHIDPYGSYLYEGALDALDKETSTTV